MATSIVLPNFTISTIIMYLMLITIVYILSSMISDRTPIKIAIISTIATSTAHLLASSIESLIPEIVITLP